MSSYLNRLAKRGQVTSEPQVLQPFVRSTSPIAEQDQRIGMAGFEDIEFGVALHAESNPEVGFGQGEVVGGSMPPPSITAVNNPGAAMVQRKMAGSTADSAPLIPSPAPAAIATNKMVKRDLPELGITTAQNNVDPNPVGQVNLHQEPTESFSMPMKVESGDSPRPSLEDRPLYPPEQQPLPRQTPGSQGESLLPETHRIGDTVPPVKGSAIAPETHNAGLEASPSAVITADALAAIPDSGTFPSRDTAQSGEVNKVRPRPVRQAQQVDVPSLEPSTRALANPSESLFEVTPFSRLDETVSPRVVIGRINVEVVPPPAVAPPAETSRSGPLTAASVSVIGPLGGRIQSNVRFSLRQR